jgi:hypothetical protein
MHAFKLQNKIGLCKFIGFANDFPLNGNSSLNVDNCISFFCNVNSRKLLEYFAFVLSDSGKLFKIRKN